MKYIWPFFIAASVAVAVYYYAEVRQLTETRREAAALLESWPGAGNTDFASNGALLGIALGGLAFLEKHQDQFPSTYKQAKAIVEARSTTSSKPEHLDAWREDHDSREEAADAMIELVRAVAGDEYDPDVGGHVSG
jgi:ribosomal protein S17E